MADGKIVLDKLFIPGPGTGDWKESVYRPEWNVYQNVYDRDYSCVLGARAKIITISNQEGDWLTMNGISIVRPDGRRTSLPADLEWGKGQEPISLDTNGNPIRPASYDSKTPLKAFLTPWDDAAAQGAAIFVGESGAYNKTPHEVVLAGFRDWLELWKERRMGWALWNFRGSFGILDSDRADVLYEDFHGHKLDRKLLALLQEYLGK